MITPLAGKTTPTTIPRIQPHTRPDLQLHKTPCAGTAPPNGAGATEPPEPLFHRLLHQVEDQSRRIDQAMNQARRGKTFSPLELLALQTKVYSYSQNMEVISRMVDRTVSSIKTTLNTQV